jgi:hypothetical protein
MVRAPIIRLRTDKVRVNANAHARKCTCTHTLPRSCTHAMLMHARNAHARTHVHAQTFAQTCAQTTCSTDNHTNSQSKRACLHKQPCRTQHHNQTT